MLQSALFKNTFGREENASGNESFINDITARYPYFGIAHFYALKQTNPSSESFNDNAAKTALFFNDLFFLNMQLQQEGEKLSAALPADVHVINHESKNTEHLNENIIPGKEEILFEPAPTEEKISAALPDDEHNSAHESENTEVLNEDAIREKEEILFEPLVAEDELPDDVYIRNNESENIELINENVIPDKEDIQFEPLHVEEELPVALPDDEDISNHELENTEVLNEDAIPEKEEILFEPLVAEDELPDDVYISNHKSENTELLHENVIPGKEEIQFEPLHVEEKPPVALPDNEQIRNYVTQSIATLIKEVIPEKEEILFEPLHATDYFASQGIKLSDVAAHSDKLGKQLKSFTAWLKTMKKVHPDKLSGADTAVDTTVRNLAEKSNAEQEVITEAMADAYFLQYKREKALEIYTKLSLLDPAKSAYFAAKIHNLKP